VVWVVSFSETAGLIVPRLNPSAPIELAPPTSAEIRTGSVRSSA
jgi:hypothetical protein